MRSNRRRDTDPELIVRSILHANGLRFRVDLPIRVPGRRPIRPDVVFPKQRVALFIDGCFWHGCPQHGTLPATNRAYWVPKIEDNRRRDARNTADLEADGWTVIRAWGHEDPGDVVARVVSAVNLAG